MRVPYETTTRTRPSAQGLDYLRAPEVDFSGITRGLNILAQGVATAEEKDRVEKDQAKRFKAYGAFNDFQAKVDETLAQTKQTSPADTSNFDETWEGIYQNLENDFINSLDPEQQEEFRMRAGDVKNRSLANAREFGTVQRREYSNNRIEDEFNRSATKLNNDPDSPTHLAEVEKSIHEFIDRAPGLSALEKEEKKRIASAKLQAIPYLREHKEGTTARPIGTAVEHPPEPKGTIESGNIDIEHRPVVRNKDGSISTLRSITIEEDVEGRLPGERIAVLIPTVREDGKYMTNDEAMDHYLKTGKHLGKFETVGEADKYAKDLSDWEGKFHSGELKPVKKLSPRAEIMKSSAAELGVDPLALAVAISYETLGKFSTAIRGGKGGDYLGLIQFGPAERAKYGVHAGQSFEEQMKAVVRYLKDRGLKAGMGLRDIYSTINAGRPGLYHKSDRPGETVDTHVLRMSNPNDPRYKAAVALMSGDTDPDGIDNDPKYSALSLEDRLALRKDAETAAAQEYAALQKQREEEHKAAVNDAYIGLYEGRYGRKEYDEQVANGLWDDYDERVKARKILDDKDNEGRYAREGAEKIGIMGRGGYAVVDPADPEDNKRMNAVIGEDGLAKIVARDDTYKNNYLIPTIRTTHVVPENVAGTLKAMVRSRNPKTALWALDTMALIQNHDTAAFNQRFDEKIARDVDFWRAKRQYYTQEELLKQINGGNTQEERQARQMLREDGEKLIKEEKKVSALSYIDRFGGLFGTGAAHVSNLPWAQVEVVRDYNAVFLEEYVRYGNVEEATEATNRALDRLWGVTEIGGIRTLMKYPPEKVNYRPVNGDYGYIERQVRNEFNLPADTQFQLLSDEKTEQDFADWREGKGTHPPSYQVVTKGPYGDWRPAKSPDGKDARIYFTITDEEKQIEESNFELKQRNFDYWEFMNDTYLPSQRMRGHLPEATRRELEEKKKELEKAVGVARGQAGLSPETPMLPHPTRKSPLPEDPLMQPLDMPGFYEPPRLE